MNKDIPDIDDIQLMNKYGISFEDNKYIYKEYRYDKLDDALTYAKMQTNNINKKAVNNNISLNSHTPIETTESQIGIIVMVVSIFIPFTLLISFGDPEQFLTILFFAIPTTISLYIYRNTISFVTSIIMILFTSYLR